MPKKKTDEPKTGLEVINETVESFDKAQEIIEPKPDNMEFWNSVCKTHPDHTKKVAYGKRNFTAVDAYSQIQKATELWGPLGGKWAIQNENYILILGEKVCLYRACLETPVGSVELMADIEVIKKSGNYNDDWSKKVSTDALTKGLSKLGFNADVFLGLFDDNKYVQNARNEFKNKIPDAGTPSVPPFVNVPLPVPPISTPQSVNTPTVERVVNGYLNETYQLQYDLINGPLVNELTNAIQAAGINKEAWRMWLKTYTKELTEDKKGIDKVMDIKQAWYNEIYENVKQYPDTIKGFFAPMVQY